MTSEQSKKIEDKVNQEIKQLDRVKRELYHRQWTTEFKEIVFETIDTLKYQFENEFIFNKTFNPQFSLIRVYGNENDKVLQDEIKKKINALFAPYMQK